MTTDDILSEQLDYYRARAKEYDASLESITSVGESFDQQARLEWAALSNEVRQIRAQRKGLELAAGTGIWTQELVSICSELTVVDGSPEMLEISRSKINDPRVRYQCVDLFSWEPDQQYDLVFFAFWLSHVPPERLAPFLDQVARAVRSGGTAFIIDEPGGGQQLSGPNEAGMYQQRTVEDGRTFRIVKVYYDPSETQVQLRKRGFEPSKLMAGQFFYCLNSRRI